MAGISAKPERSAPPTYYLGSAPGSEFRAPSTTLRTHPSNILHVARQFLHFNDI